MLIQIIILNLAEIPVICIQKLLEISTVSVLRKSDTADLPGSLLFPDPLIYTFGTQPLPGLHIIEHMHEIIIHMVSPEPLQLFLKAFLQTCLGLDQIMG